MHLAKRTLCVHEIGIKVDCPGCPCLCVAGCAGKKELRRLENSYQEQLQEYAQQLQAGELTKDEHDSKVALLNSRYGNRRAQLERADLRTGVRQYPSVLGNSTADATRINRLGLLPYFLFFVRRNSSDWGALLKQLGVAVEVV